MVGLFNNRIVKGEERVTDILPLNTGEWYHLVVTWSSKDGNWKLYINRRLVSEGTGLKKGEIVQGGGVLVIGQEQDCLGGCFSLSQEFIGTFLIYLGL